MTHRLKACLLCGLSSLVLAASAPATTFMVTNTADAGTGSLRQAILDANGNAGTDQIALS
jgi:hypothetical protein